MLRSRHRRLLAWLGLFAMALVLIAPSIGQWRQAQRTVLDDALASAICVADVSLSPAHSRSQDHGPLSPACGYCWVATHLSPVPGTTDPISPARFLLRRSLSVAPATLLAEALPPSPLPRAPPRFD
ncbi:DUF2946 family protein [Pandoraea communis]|uniref:DUF2946 family protein n=1 Tax=Pandoraea communis TaxID=2508297 RepID=UPI003570E7E4